MKITALIENKAGNGLVCEHGLAVLIEYEGKKYLLDAGASDSFLQNALNLGINLEEIDAAILSHSHYDHSGGFEGFFKINKKANLYLQSTADELCYEKIGPISKYIGIPRNIIENYQNRLIFVKDNLEIAKGVHVIRHTTPDLDKRGKRAKMYRKENITTSFTADDFSHEQSLVFETEKGLVILNSCCHAGADTVVKEVKQIFPGKEILALIGGFHLMGIFGPKTLGMGSLKKEIEKNKNNETEKLVYESGRKKVRLLARTLEKLGVQQIYTGHCTGDPAFGILQEELGNKIHYFSTATVLEW